MAPKFAARRNRAGAPARLAAKKRLASLPRRSRSPSPRAGPSSAAPSDAPPSAPIVPTWGARQLASREWASAWRTSRLYEQSPLFAFFAALNPWPCSNHTLTPFVFQHNRYDSVEHAYLAMQALALELPSIAAAILSPHFRNLPKKIKHFSPNTQQSSTQNRTKHSLKIGRPANPI